MAFPGLCGVLFNPHSSGTAVTLVCRSLCVAIFKGRITGCTEREAIAKNPHATLDKAQSVIQNYSIARHIGGCQLLK